MRQNAVNMESERIAAIPLTYFGLNGPLDVPCLSLRYHIAQKFHGMTRPSPMGASNERFRDAMDLLLLRELVQDIAAVRIACEETFEVCAEHLWPPDLQFPESWREPFTALAAEVNLPITDLSVATEELGQFLQAIIATGST